MTLQRVVFLDRDGTINHDLNYVYKLEDLKLIDGIQEILRYLRNQGYLLIVITNQSGIARGYFSIDDFDTFNREVQKQVGIEFDKIYFCPHKSEDNCDCRKPKTGMLLKAKKDFNIDFSQSYFIGDKDSDIECGQSVGCKTILVKGNQYKNVSSPDFVITSLYEITNIIF